MLCDCYQYAKRHSWIGKPFREGGRLGDFGVWRVNESEVRRRLTIWVCAFLTRSVCTFDVDACIRDWRYRCFGGLRHMMRRFRSGNTCCEYRETHGCLLLLLLLLYSTLDHIYS